MSGHRFFIEDMMRSLGARLVNIASHWEWAEMRRLIVASAEVENTAGFLEKVWRERKRMSEEQLQAYQSAKMKVMTYLLYYDRLQRFRSGEPDSLMDESPVNEKLGPASYDDWMAAKRKANKLFSEYVRSAQPSRQPAGSMALKT